MKKPASFQTVTTIRHASAVLLLPSQLCAGSAEARRVICSSRPYCGV